MLANHTTAARSRPLSRRTNCCFLIVCSLSEVKCDIRLEEFVCTLHRGDGISARQVAVGDSANNVSRGRKRLVHSDGPIVSGLQSYSASARDLLAQKIIAA